MRFRMTEEDEPRLGITPLIDIVFLLLIFFMLTSHFHIASGLPIRLPKAGQKVFDREGEKATLVIDRLGRLYMEGKRLDLKALSPKLKNLVKKKGLVHLLLEADKEVKHGRVVQVMDVAKSAGVPSLIITAQWDPEKAF